MLDLDTTISISGNRVSFYLIFITSSLASVQAQAGPAQV